MEQDMAIRAAFVPLIATCAEVTSEALSTKRDRFHFSPYISARFKSLKGARFWEGRGKGDGFPSF